MKDLFRNYTHGLCYTTTGQYCPQNASSLPTLVEHGTGAPSPHSIWAPLAAKDAATNHG